MNRKTIAEWARGMADIFENSNGKNVTSEIENLLLSIGLERPVEQHWSDI